MLLQLKLSLWRWIVGATLGVRCPVSRVQMLTMGDKRMLREKGQLPVGRDLD